MNPPITQCVVSDGVTESCLPLEHLEVRATIIDTACEVTVVQRFRNHATSGALRYVFSAPGGSTVSGLKLRTEDGTVISTTPRQADAPCGPTHDARKGSIDHNGGELFSMSLKDVSGPQNLIFEIKYFTNLVIEDPGRLRLHIPKSMVSPRAAIRASDVGALPERVRIVVDVYTPRFVISVTSSTHKIMDTSYKHNNTTHHHHRRASLVSATPLTTDFILFVSAEGFESPRCIAQRNLSGAIGMQLSLIPRFDGLESSAPEEYLFLIDRSYSMTSEDRMATAKTTLAMLLHMLPEGTAFNIFAFSEDCEQFRDTSTIYNSASQTEAIKYVEQIGIGSGTSIYGALHTALNLRNGCRHTVCFLITDGEDNNYGPQEVAAVVSQKVAQADPNFPLRVFTVGIGNMSVVGRKTCDAVAHAGHGLYRLAKESRTIMEDCTTLFEAGRTIVLKNVSIDWNVGSRYILQTPAEIPPLQAESHVLVYALVEDGACPVPDQVAVHAQRDGVGEVLKFVIPVEEIRLARRPARGDDRLQLIHTLAARGIVADRQRGYPAAMAPDNADTITGLGTRYQFQTPFTPFVAVNVVTGQTVAVQSTAQASPSVSSERGLRELSLLAHKASSAHISLPDEMSHSAPCPPVVPSTHMRELSTISAPSENEIYGFPLSRTDPVISRGVRSVPPLQDAEAASLPVVNVSNEVASPGPVHSTPAAVDSAVAGVIPIPHMSPATTQQVGENNIISHLWHPEYWMCLVICGRQHHANDVRRDSASRLASNDGTPHDVRNAPAGPGTAAVVAHAVALQTSVSPSADATSPTAKHSSFSRGSSNIPPTPLEKTLLYLPSRPVAFFDASARCPSTKRVKNWKLALFGTPKPRPFCKTRKEETDRQVQDFIEGRRAALVKLTRNGPKSGKAVHGSNYYAEDFEDEVDTENVVEPQPDDDGWPAYTDGSAAQKDSNAQQLILMQASDGSFPSTLRFAQTIGVPNCLEQASRANVEGKIWATALAVMFLRKCLRSQRVLRRRIVAKATEFLEASGMSEGEIEQLLHRARAALGPNVAAPANDLAIDVELR